MFILSSVVFNSNDPKFNVANFYFLGDGMVSFILNDIMFRLLWISGYHIVVLVVGNFYLDVGS